MAERVYFSVEWPDLPAFEAAFRAAPETLRSELTTAARTIETRGASLSTTYAPIWTGDVTNRIYGKVEQSGDTTSAIWGSTSDHALFADRGRRPGKMPPKGALIGWRGVTEENEFVIRRAIGRHGTKGKPFVTRAFTELKGGFALKEIGDAIKRTLAKLGGG